MSNNVNTELLEKIAERIDGYSGEYSDFEYFADKAIKQNDLEKLQWLLNNYCQLCGEQYTANCNNANCTYKGGTK